MFAAQESVRSYMMVVLLFLFVGVAAFIGGVERVARCVFTLLARTCIRHVSRVCDFTSHPLRPSSTIA